MVAPVGQDQDEAAMKRTKPLPRAIQMVMTISSLLEPCAPASTETIEEHGVCRFYAWMKLVFVPSMCIAHAAIGTVLLLVDADDDEVISGGGGIVFLAVPVLLQVYFAVVQAAGGYLDLFAPQTPYAAWVALHEVGFEKMGGALLLSSFGAMGLYMLMRCKAWLLLVACACLLGLLVASTIAFGLCLLGTYGGGQRRDKNSSCSRSEALDGLAYLYTRLLYEYAVRFLVDADAGVQQLDTESDSTSLE